VKTSERADTSAVIGINRSPNPGFRRGDLHGRPLGMGSWPHSSQRDARAAPPHLCMNRRSLIIVTPFTSPRCHPEPQRRVCHAGHRDASLRLSMSMMRDLRFMRIRADNAHERIKGHRNPHRGPINRRCANKLCAYAWPGYFVNHHNRHLQMADSFVNQHIKAREVKIFYRSCQTLLEAI
jgi:hypothetical protein